MKFDECFRCEREEIVPGMFTCSKNNVLYERTKKTIGLDFQHGRSRMKFDECFRCEREEIVPGMFTCSKNNVLRARVTNSVGFSSREPSFQFQLGDESNIGVTVSLSSARTLAAFFERAARVLEGRL